MRGYPDRAPRGPDGLELIRESHGVPEVEHTITPEEEAAEAGDEAEDDPRWAEYNRRMNALLKARNGHPEVGEAR